MDEENKNIDETSNQKDSQDNENSLSEEEIRELNLYAEEQRQASIAKYGRDIYKENIKIGNEKFQKASGIIEKILSFFFGHLALWLIIGLLIILFFVWIPLSQQYS